MKEVLCPDFVNCFNGISTKHAERGGGAHFQPPHVDNVTSMFKL